MTFYRCIKPNWAKPMLKDEPNPEFVQEIDGNDIIEGCFDKETVQILNSLGYNIYWMPNHPSTDIYAQGKWYANGNDIDVFNYIFIDIDLKDKVYASKEEVYAKLSEFSLKPSMVVDSGHGVHAYWRILDLDRESYVLLQLNLIHYFKSDPSVWTVLQLMRVPNYVNTKHYDSQIMSTRIEDVENTDKEYTLNDLPSELFTVSEIDNKKAQNHLDKLDGKLQINVSQDVNLDELPESFIDLMYENQQVSDLFNNPTMYKGDRSSADLKLANILYNKDIKKNDALAVIANTQKALSKGSSRYEYAIGTVDKAYIGRAKNRFMTVAQQIRMGIQDTVGEPVNGPTMFDCLTKPWAKKQVLGLIAGPSIGKTCVALKILKDMIFNNPTKDDVYVFFSLEMPAEDIVERWIALVGKESDLANRLYVIGNEDELGEPRNIGIQEVFEYTTEIKKQTGKEVGCVAIDHIGIMSRVVDLHKKYTFGAENELQQRGDKRCLSMENLATQLKPLAKMLNVFLIVLTQTTKGKGTGDVPIAIDGAYGISQFENIADYIITIWQPLLRVQHLLDAYFLSFHYAKVREKRRTDPLRVLQPRLLSFEPNTGELSMATPEEYDTLKDLIPKATEARENSEKKKVCEYNYSNSAEDLENILNKIRPNKK